MKSLLRSARQHSLLLTFLLSLSVAAGLSNALLRADLTTGPPVAAGTGASSSSRMSDQWRACTSTGTVFQDMVRPADAIKTFEAYVSEVVEERWQLMNNPTLWPCFDPSGFPQPPMPKLNALADLLPGWHYMRSTNTFGVTQTVKMKKPVTWENFTSVVMEFEREYECKLAELQDQTVYTVLTNSDIEGPNMADPSDVQFCCLKSGNGCRDVQSANGQCDTGRYMGPDSMCNAECEPDIFAANLSYRLLNHKKRMLEERQRARTAIERTVNTMRSFEMHLPFTLEMNCLQRAALDLKNELALTADAVSCMPKIWDSVTSLHDRK